MRIERPFDWLTRFTKARSQPPGGFDLVEVVQPTIDVACNWPLEYKTFTKQTTLANGNNNIDLYPGKEENPTTYPAHERHHAVYVHLAVVLSASLALQLKVHDTVRDLSVDEMWSQAATTSHYPLSGAAGFSQIIPDRRYMCWPYVLRLVVVSATAGQTATVTGVRFDRPQSEPVLM